MASSSVIL